MSITTISGPVTIISRGQQMALRIGDRAAFMKSAIDNISNGDRVTAAGIAEAEFNILALRNESTRLIYTVPDPGSGLKFILIVGTALSIITLPLMLAGAFIFWQVWTFYKKNRALSDNIQAAKRMLEGAASAEEPVRPSVAI